MAIAWGELVTFFPLPDRSVPFFFLRIALFTDSCAFLEYFAIIATVHSRSDTVKNHAILYTYPRLQMSYRPTTTCIPFNRLNQWRKSG